MNNKEELSNPILCTIIVTKSDMEALIRIRNYFGESGKTQIEHIAYDVLDRALNPFIEESKPLNGLGKQIIKKRVIPKVSQNDLEKLNEGI